MPDHSTALTPENLQKLIATADAEARAATARAADLRERLEALQRGELPPEVLRVNIMALGLVDGWLTMPRICGWYPFVPIHQIEKAFADLVAEGRLIKSDKVERSNGRGRPAKKYICAEQAPHDPAVAPGSADA